MNWLQSPLLRALREPARMRSFSDGEWDLAVRHARSADLLGRLAYLARDEGLLPDLPLSLRRHFSAIESIVVRQHNAVRWEIQQISAATAPAGIRVVLLKGAAYAAAGGPAAVGRTFTDVDILVPKEQLDAAEHVLHVAGWLMEGHSAYDIRYYRRWMHELPPMFHLRRGTALDVHHSLLPETARLRTRPELVVADAQALPSWPNIHVPSTVDQILHSACHLFHEGEWAHGLRDLSDLDLMLSGFTRAGGTAQTLLQRAQALNLTLPLAYAVRYAAVVLHTKLPEGLETALRRSVGRAWMDTLFLRALSTAHPELAQRGAAMALKALYVRSHWLRMPLRLLIPHLVHQAWVSRQKDVAAQ